MNARVDPTVTTILTTLGLDPKQALWNCHGVWVMYHKALEKVAADLGITFAPPQILESNGLQKSVAICVTATHGERTEWSIGEAAPGNNKNSYPWAMAEKRAKDRVILKLVGLHGLIFSEDEMDNSAPKQEGPPAPPARGPKIDINEPAPMTNAESAAHANELIKELKSIRQNGDRTLLDRWTDTRTVTKEFDDMEMADRQRVRDTYAMVKRDLAGTVIDAG